MNACNACILQYCLFPALLIHHLMVPHSITNPPHITKNLFLRVQKYFFGSK